MKKLEKSREEKLKAIEESAKNVLKMSSGYLAGQKRLSLLNLQRKESPRKRLSERLLSNSLMLKKSLSEFGTIRPSKEWHRDWQDRYPIRYLIYLPNSYEKKIKHNPVNHEFEVGILNEHWEAVCNTYLIKHPNIERVFIQYMTVKDNELYHTIDSVYGYTCYLTGLSTHEDVEYSLLNHEVLFDLCHEWAISY